MTDTTANLDWRTALAASHRALQTTVDAIGDDQWHLPTPCSEWTVTQVVQHAAADQLAYASALGVGDGPTYDPFSPSGAIDGSATDLVRDAIAPTASAWADVADDRATAPTPLPHGELPVEIASGACALDAAVHAWDIARAIGAPSPLGDELSAQLLAVAREIVEPLRNYGVYAAIVESEGEAGAEDTFLRYLGRDPHWTA
ncbi:TIGR03086 family metal-binding protein [Antrihabitans sp. NCIMB 15449]|uniref:TIGR03086 family metal-binding protein n=1 Tax=Antrihabitans spumae TaxID=3373370 RepID=A0ABW7JNP9_9NOCA